MILGLGLGLVVLTVLVLIYCTHDLSDCCLTVLLEGNPNPIIIIIIDLFKVPKKNTCNYWQLYVIVYYIYKLYLFLFIYHFERVN